MNHARLIIATIKAWNVANAIKFKESHVAEYKVSIIDEKEKLTFDVVRELDPTFIFFLHWSWMIPDVILKNYECVMFHMTDLPFGRGGSPLQNLLVRRIYNTKITAFRASTDLDAGDIYVKHDFSIAEGSAEGIYRNASDLIFSRLIPEILSRRPKPYPQQGEVVTFRRRKAEESNLQEAELSSLRDLYDFIRMLDAEGYPAAYVEVGGYRCEFSHAILKPDQVEANVRIIKK